MANMAVQLLGFFLGLLGFFGTAVAMVMPQWRCTGYMSSNIISALAYMKGLWMECVWNSAGIYQCEVHRSALALPQDLQVARALMVLSCLTSALATGLATAGMECTRCIRRSPAKSALATAGGGCFVAASLFCLVTVSWTTAEVVRDFSTPLLPDGAKYEIGQAVYVGFVSASLSLVGGVVLCMSCGNPKKHYPYFPQSLNTYQLPAPDHQPTVVYKESHTPSHSSVASSGYRLSDYV